MPTATENPIPKSASAPQHTAAAKQQCNEAPPLALAAIGRALWEADDAHRKADRGATEATDTKEEHQHALVIETMLTRLDALRALAMTLRPISLEDAAVTIGAAVEVAYDLLANEFDADQVTRRSGSILRVLLRSLPLIVEAAGLDREGFAWVPFNPLAARELPRVAPARGQGR